MKEKHIELDPSETSASPLPKRTFVEPRISEPVDVVKGNPSANALFAVAVTLGNTPDL